MKDINFLRSNNVNVDQSLQILGDVDTYNEVIKEFYNGVDEKLKLIETYKNNNDLANYAIYAHSLKSDARYLGFANLASISYNHEMESKAGNISYVNDHYNELIEEANNVIKVVKAYLEDDNSSTDKEHSSDDKKQVLVADDSTIIRNLIEKMVGEDYKVISAVDGKEAIDKIEENKDNLIGMLLDLNMPNVDGFKVLEYLKNNNLLLKVPVAIITGDDSKETIYKAFDYQIVDVLPKPFNERDVKRVISAMIMHKQ